MSLLPHSIFLPPERRTNRSGLIFDPKNSGSDNEVYINGCDIHVKLKQNSVSGVEFSETNLLRLL